MRYYIYLDKELIKNIYSVMGNVDFSIDFLEFSEENITRVNNHVNIEPSRENSCDIDKKKYRNVNRKRTSLSYDYSTSLDKKKARRYINIQDITDIKCLGFYHDLLSKLDTNVRGEDDKICKEVGTIEPYIFKGNRDNNLSFDNDIIFKINNSYICYNKEKMCMNLNLISTTNCKINVIGYTLNSCFNENYKLLKAIAMYIE